MTNKGVEISATYKKYEGDFHYELGGNFTSLKNKVTKIGTANIPIEGVASITQVGHSMENFTVIYPKAYSSLLMKLIQLLLQMQALIKISMPFRFQYQTWRCQV